MLEGNTSRYVCWELYCHFVFHSLWLFLSQFDCLGMDVILLCLFSHFSLDFHLRINLDIVSIVPLILEPIDFIMKWVSTHGFSCLFVFFIMLCFGPFIYILDIKSMSLFLDHIFWFALWNVWGEKGTRREKGLTENKRKKFKIFSGRYWKMMMRFLLVENS